MAMNKKEQAEMAELRRELATVLALRWTQPSEPDLPKSELHSGQEINGWHYNVHTKNVSQWWSTSISHGQGQRHRFGGSRQGRSLYSTKKLALRALRHLVEREAAGHLRDIDERIAQCDE